MDTLCVPPGILCVLPVPTANRVSQAGSGLLDAGRPVHWGVEHAILHLMYARFFTKALYDAGMLSP